MSRRTRTTRRSRTPQLSGIVLLILLLAAYALVQYERGALGGATGDQGAPTAAAPASTTPAGSASGGAGWYEVFFTTPRYPDDKASHHGGLDAKLVALIDSATSTIDLADYDFDLENVASALARATGRGVVVRMVTDSDTLGNDDPAVQRAFAILKDAKIPFVGDGREPIMHNKFLVVDHAVVWTGSWNFTDGDAYRLNNNAIQIRSPELAQNYTAEFEKMFVRRLFGPSKPAGVPHPVLEIGGVRVENYFAPEDKVADKIVARLRGARQTIHFMAFSFTSDPLAQALLDRARAGVTVGGVFETTGSNTQFSEFGKLKQAGLDVHQDGNPYVMHHKVFIIDGQTVIFGSYNFSSNAEKDNDENLLIVDDPALAQAFEAEYQRVYAQALNPPKR